MELADPTPPSAGEWLKRLLLQLVDRAAFDVDDLAASPDSGLHRLRLRMKKAEALLRLSKGAVRKTSRWRLRKQFRDIKNAGGGQRDAVVVAELAEELGRKGGLHLALAPVHRSKPNAAKLRSMLAQLRRELAEEIFDALTWDDIGDNYAATYRSGRRCMRAAGQSQDSADFHRWRKRVKALHYQTQALSNFTAHPKQRLHQTKKLAKLLGKDHDLTLLEEAADATSPDNPWREIVAARRCKVRPQVLALGCRLYRQPSRRFARLRGLPG